LILKRSLAAKRENEMITSRYKAIVGFLIVFGLIIFGTLTAKADIILGANFEFSGGSAPASGTAPWIQAQFSDVSPGTVELTLSTPNLTGSEFVSDWDLNIDPSFNPTNLTFTLSGNPNSITLPTTPIPTGIDSFQADGDGLYDIKFAFATAGNKVRFTGGKSISYTITSSQPGLSASLFNVLSTPAGGHGPYLMAAHVQNTPTIIVNGNTVNSGWVAPLAPVPEPSTIILLSMASCALVAFARRQRKV
jgi:hypothetical protein